MEQLLLHLLGDYITQTDWMAKNKREDWRVALIHATVYTVPFIFVFNASFMALTVILWSHALIDHFALARYVIFAKNWVTNPKLKWNDCNKTGYPESVPAWMSVWLLIIADNTMHLGINYLSLRYL